MHESSAPIPMAAGDYDLFRDTGYATLQTPVFQMTGELDPATGGSSEPIWKALAGAPHRRLTILGGGHQTFTDFSGILEQFDGLIEPEEGHRILRIYTLAYAQYLLGDTDRIDVLNGTLPSPTAPFSPHKPRLRADPNDAAQTILTPIFGLHSAFKLFNPGTLLKFFFHDFRVFVKINYHLCT